jgi:hypothetical protein
MEVELLARTHGVIVIFLPNSHPYLNPIEQVWRAIKWKYRSSIIHKTQANLWEFITQPLTGEKKNIGLMTEEQLERQAHRTELIRRDFYKYGGVPKTENQVGLKGFVPSPPPDFSDLELLLGDVMTDEGLLSHQLYAHYLNQARIKPFGRGLVSTKCLKPQLTKFL